MTQLYLQDNGISPYTRIMCRLLVNLTNILLVSDALTHISKYLSLRNLSDCHQRIRQAVLDQGKNTWGSQQSL